MTRKALTLGALVALLACGSAQAADDFHITAGGDQFWGPSSGGIDDRAATKREATGTMTDANGSVDYRVQAGPGVARVSLDGHVASGPGVPFNPSLQAISTTDLTITGPQPEVTMSMNLHVDGVIESTVCGGPSGASCGTLEIFINAPTGVTAARQSDFNARGETRVNGLGLAFDPIPGGYHVHGDVTSPEFGLQTGHPNGLGIVLNLSGRFGGNPAGESFGGSFDDPGQRWQVSFAPRGPVLNLPPGYTASGSGVVNNRWDDPFSDDTVVSDCNDPALANVTTVPASLVLRCNGAAFPNLTHIGGDLVLDGNAGNGDLDLSNTSVGGAIDVSGTGGDLTIDVGSVGGAIDVSSTGGDLTIDTGSVGGAIDVSGTGGDLTVDVGSVGGAIDVSGTGGDLTVDTGSVGGAIDVSGTGGDLTIDPGTTGGDLVISDNPDADVVDVGAGQIGGDLVITDDGTAVVNANDSLTVSGDADVETDGGGMLDLSNVAVDGDETVAADDAAGVSATTAGGTTDVSILGGTAAMHVVLPDGTFDEPVDFTITRGGDDPAQGGIDPIAGYSFAFAVPTLNADARLAFTIDLSKLDAATRAALLAGTATIATKGDAAGSVYHAFPRCAGTQTPAADGCVAMTLLKADGSVAPAGTAPAFARFDGIAGHFSTWAVALVEQPDGSTGTTISTAQIRALLRSEIAPHGKAARIRALLKHGYRLRFDALTAGTAKIRWYRLRTGHKPVLVAAGGRAFAAADRATIKVKLTRAGRRQLRHAKRLKLTAKGTFTPAGAAPVRAARRFTVKR